MGLLETTYDLHGKVKEIRKEGHYKVKLVTHFTRGW